MATAYVEVPLGGQKAAGRVAIIDVEDYDLISPWNWCLFEQVRQGRLHGPYAIRRTPPGGGTTLMHKLITGFDSTDHQDHDGLNNRRSNLRDGARNQQNVRMHLSGSSRFKGVTRRPHGWVAQLGHRGKNYYLGFFSDEEDAALAYDAAAWQMFGEYACLNFPEATRGHKPMAASGH